jgi:hypothetical protein
MNKSVRKVSTWLALCVALFGSACQAETARVTGSRIIMDRPSGFEKAPNFAGFQNAELGASIMVTEVPGPYSKVTAGFDQTQMARRGMTLVSKYSAPVSGMQGLLLEITQSASGTDFRKWIHAFGNDTLTVLVTATFPETLKTQLSERLRRAVLTTTFDSSIAPPSKQHDLPFTISPVPGLKPAGRIQNMLMFNPSGELPHHGAAAGHSTLFIVGQALSDLTIEDRKLFARRRLSQTPHLSGVEIQAESDVTISGLPGREIMASATGKAGEKLFVYQTILYGRGSYFIMQGLADASIRTAQEPLFKAIARTFKLK